MNNDEIRSVFTGLGLPLIERGVRDVRFAKERLVHHQNVNSAAPSYEVIASSGTRLTYTDKNAKLERGSR